jgi:hypothetical protein
MRKVVTRRRRKKQMGSFDMGTDLTIIVFVAGGVGIYFLGSYLGLWGSGSDSSTSQGNATTAAQATADIATQTNAGDPPNYDGTQYQTWASTIFAQGSSIVPSSDSAGVVLAIMDSLDNLADVYSLISAFGTQSTGIAPILTFNYDLPQWINKAFTSAAVASFNQQLSYNNVQFTW